MIWQTLNAYVAATTKVWQHDRSKSIGASEIGQCSKRIFYLKSGQKPDSDFEDDWGARVRGSMYEDCFWAPAMQLRFGKKLLYSGKDQKTFIDGRLSATPDGLLTSLKRDALKHLGVKDIKSDCIMVECKTIDPRVTLDEAKMHNVFQTHVQMHLVRKHTKYQPNYSLLNYTDASFWSKVTEFCIEYDPKIAKAAEQRASKIITAKSSSEFEPEGWIAGGKECSHCPFLKTCGIERRNLPFQDTLVDPQFKAEMIDMVRAANVIDRQLKEDTAQLRTAQVAIKDRLREKGVKKIPGVVSWSTVKGRTGYDMSKLLNAATNAGVDVEQFSTQGDAGDRLVLSEISDPTMGSDT